MNTPRPHPEDDDVYELEPAPPTPAPSSPNNDPPRALPTTLNPGRGADLDPFEPLRLDRPPVGLPDKCPNCGYETKGMPTPICPECGKPVRWEDVDYKQLVRASRIDNTLYTIGWTLYIGGFVACYYRIGNPAGFFICCSPLIALTTVPILLRVFDDTFREFILFCGVISALWAGFVWVMT